MDGRHALRGDVPVRGEQLPAGSHGEPGGGGVGTDRGTRVGMPAAQHDGPDIRRVVRALNLHDDDEKHNLLVEYARAHGAIYISASGVWFDPPTTSSSLGTPDA